jgi:hypothetical protein
LSCIAVTIPFELEDPFFAGDPSWEELSQAWQRGSSPLTQIGDDIVNDPVEAVGGFGLGNSGLPGQTAGEFIIPHRVLSVTAGPLIGR